MNEQKKSGLQDEVLLCIVIAGLACLFYYKFFPKLYHYWYTHKFLCYSGLTFIVGSAIIALGTLAWNYYVKRENDKGVTASDERAVLLGKDESNRNVYLKESFRRTHAQIIGSTSAGKTESTVLPWIIKDLENGSGCLIIDGKSDIEFLNKLYAYVVKTEREKDFRLFSLVDIESSTPFNPFIGGTVQEISERVFSSFPIDHPHYKPVQQKMFSNLITLAKGCGINPTFSLIHRLLTDMDFLASFVTHTKDEELKRILDLFVQKSERDRTNETSGLEANLSPFSVGEHAALFNSENGIEFDDILKNNRICYFQLPTMLYPFLGEATGKLVLQSFQSAVAKRHVGLSGRNKFFSCYLDDFQDYIYRGFGALLNKSRSANVGIVFSHQALGDLDKVGPDFRNILLTNTNVKVIMRNNDPPTCDYFAKSFGTRTTEKRTERRTRNTFGETSTGEGSIREVEEFIYHPNIIRQLGVGEGIVSIPHPTGVKTMKIKFPMRPNLEPVEIPIVEKAKSDPNEILLKLNLSNPVKKNRI